MSEVRDPERDQVAPVPNDNPSCHDLVIEDLLERKQFGLRKYGTILQAGNGRSFIRDAYEEVMDLAVYLRGKLEEEREANALRIDLTGMSTTIECEFNAESGEKLMKIFATKPGDSIQLALWEDKA